MKVQLRKKQFLFNEATYYGTVNIGDKIYSIDFYNKNDRSTVITVQYNENTKAYITINRDYSKVMIWFSSDLSSKPLFHLEYAGPANNRNEASNVALTFYD